MNARRPGGLAFDVYGTLVDVSHMGRELARPRLDGSELAAAWRRHQLEISWLLSKDVWLVSANPFDCAGATSAGLGVVKVEREPTLSYGFAGPPDLVVGSLRELADALA